MAGELAAKIAAVTGGASGIGLASNVVVFMLTRPRGMTIRDVVMLATHFGLQYTPPTLLQTVP